MQEWIESRLSHGRNKKIVNDDRKSPMCIILKYIINKKEKNKLLLVKFETFVEELLRIYQREVRENTKKDTKYAICADEVLNNQYCDVYILLLLFNHKITHGNYEDAEILFEFDLHPTISEFASSFDFEKNTWKTFLEEIKKRRRIFSNWYQFPFYEKDVIFAYRHFPGKRQEKITLCQQLFMTGIKNVMALLDTSGDENHSDYMKASKLTFLEARNLSTKLIFNEKNSDNDTELGLYEKREGKLLQEVYAILTRIGLMSSFYIAILDFMTNGLHLCILAMEEISNKMEKAIFEQKYIDVSFWPHFLQEKLFLYQKFVTSNEKHFEWLVEKCKAEIKPTFEKWRKLDRSKIPIPLRFKNIITKLEIEFPEKKPEENESKKQKIQ